MNPNIDGKIKTILLENDIDLTHKCRERIAETIHMLPDKEEHKRRIKFRLAAVIAVACLFLTSITVAAAINYVRQRMESLSEDEKDSYYKGLQESTANADGYSRELTDHEKEKMEELKEKYKNGTFPVQTLTRVKTQTDADDITEFYFVEDSSLFVLPSRQLTDEEMLEMIDFYYSRDYSLAEKVEQEKTDIDNTQGLMENAEMNENEAIEIAKEEVKKIYGTDCKDYNITADYDDAGGYGSMYRVEITDKKSMSNYNVTVDADKKIVTEVYYTPESDHFDTGMKVDKDKFVAKYEDALDILTKRMGIDLPILQSTCEYNYNSEGFLERGVVSYLFEMEDGTGYVLKYNFTSDVFFDIFTTDYEAYRKAMDQNKSNRQKRGLEREIIQRQ